MKALRYGVVVPGLILAISAGAQMDMTEVTNKVSQARQACAQKARDNKWPQRTDVKVKGETKSRKTEIVRSTVASELQKTPIDETSVKKPRGVRQGRRRVEFRRL